MVKYEVLSIWVGEWESMKYKVLRTYFVNGQVQVFGTTISQGRMR